MRAEWEKGRLWFAALAAAALAALPFAGAAAEEGHSVRVRVTAERLSDQAIVGVNGAEVQMYSGQGTKGEAVTYLGSYRTDGEGYVTISIPEEYSGEEALSGLTFSAKKTVAAGDGVSGTERDRLFEVYQEPRMQLELHSEEIDVNGNWIGKKLPAGNATDVDLAFVIDTTGSMEDNIALVRSNIAQFAQQLSDDGLNLRMSVIEYRDIEEDGPDSTVQHALNYSPWFASTDQLTETLDGLRVDGGGDDDETPIDALHLLLGQKDMNWRSTANKFAFVLTDAGYKNANSYGYGSLREVAEKLREDGIVTSVIGTAGYSDVYREVCDVTGGSFADIDSEDFTSQMMDLANSIIRNADNELELRLSEPRLLIDYAVCYYAENEQERMDDGCYNTVRDHMKEVSHSIAKATDGHVLLNKVYLFSTSERGNFFVEDWETVGSGEDVRYRAVNAPTSAMADIRIMSGRNEPNVVLTANAYPNGFYVTDLVSDFSQKNAEIWENIIQGKKEFTRIELTWRFDGASIGETRYAHTAAHETGHYLMGFYDEYLNGSGQEWRRVGRPEGAPENFGLMEYQWLSLELSKAFNYGYLNGDYDQEETNTYHSYQLKKSTEDFLAERLCQFAAPLANGYEALLSSRTEEEYRAAYTKTLVYAKSGEETEGMTPEQLERWDRTAEYPYAILEDRDFVDLRNPENWNTDDIEIIREDETLRTTGTGREPFDGALAAVAASADTDLGRAPGSTSESAVYTREALAEVIPEFSEHGVRLTLSSETGAELQLFRKESEDGAGACVLSPVAVTDGQAELSLAGGESCELVIAAKTGEGWRFNSCLLERSGYTEAGYGYRSADFTQECGIVPSTADDFLFMTLGADLKQGAYTAVNNAVQIQSQNGAEAAGEIISVADVMEEMDHTSLCWFYCRDGVWMPLESRISREENGNIRVCCDYAGDGIYALMAKAAAKRTVQRVQKVAYERDGVQDGVLYISFEDPNPDTRYYDLYYSEHPFSEETEEGVCVVRYDASEPRYGLNLGQHDLTAYVGVSAVMPDGARSEMTDVMEVNTGAVDRDGDGIPDWYCDRYQLWPHSGLPEGIADGDADGDGYPNYEEYLGGSSPTDINDPVRTEIIAAEGIRILTADVVVAAGGQVRVSAVVLPENASNQNVQWHVENPELAHVAYEGSDCTVTGAAEGRTRLIAVTEDGGFTAEAGLTVSAGAESSVMPEEAMTEEQSEELPDERLFQLKEHADTIKYMSSYTRDREIMTRYETLVVLNRLFDIKPETAGQRYPDVDGEYVELVNRFSDIGVLWESTDGRFHGDGYIQRGELAHILRFLFRQSSESYLTSIPSPASEVTREEFMDNLNHLISLSVGD